MDGAGWRLGRGGISGRDGRLVFGAADVGAGGVAGRRTGWLDGVGVDVSVLGLGEGSVRSS